jgi:hypothetical protein
MENDIIILSYEIYHPKNTNHNQDGHHMTIKYGLQLFFETTENDGYIFWPA